VRACPCCLRARAAEWSDRRVSSTLTLRMVEGKNDRDTGMRETEKREVRERKERVGGDEVAVLRVRSHEHMRNTAPQSSCTLFALVWVLGDEQ